MREVREVEVIEIGDIEKLRREKLKNPQHGWRCCYLSIGNSGRGSRFPGCGGLVFPEMVNYKQAGSGQNPITFKETPVLGTKPTLSFVLVASGRRVYSIIWRIFHHRTLRDSLNNFVS